VATGEAPPALVGPARGGAPAGGTALADPQAGPLTRREGEVAQLVAAGLGNQEIADRLVLSKRTVDSHLNHIFKKLGLSSRTQLAGWVLEEGKSTSV